VAKAAAETAVVGAGSGAEAATAAEAEATAAAADALDVGDKAVLVGVSRQGRFHGRTATLLKLLVCGNKWETRVSLDDGEQMFDIPVQNLQLLTKATEAQKALAQADSLAWNKERERAATAKAEAERVAKATAESEAKAIQVPGQRNASGFCIPECSFWCGRKESVHMQRKDLVYPWLWKTLKLGHQQLIDLLAESAVVDRCWKSANRARVAIGVRPVVMWVCFAALNAAPASRRTAASALFTEYLSAQTFTKAQVTAAFGDEEGARRWGWLRLPPDAAVKAKAAAAAAAAKAETEAGEGADDGSGVDASKSQTHLATAAMESAAGASNSPNQPVEAGAEAEAQAAVEAAATAAAGEAAATAAAAVGAGAGAASTTASTPQTVTST
jgi:hypothetical protein